MKFKQKQPTPASGSGSDKAKKQTEAPGTSTKIVPLPATGITDPVQAPSQPVPPAFERRVSFSDQLTRGPGRSYTPPPADGKAVRFAPSLVRGEGSSYSDLSPRKSEVFPFDRVATSSSDPSQRASKLSADQSASIRKSQTVTMGGQEKVAKQDEQMEFEYASDSDDSFTDIVMPAKSVKESVSQRQNAVFRHYCQPAQPTTSKPFSRFVQTSVTAGQYGYQSEIGDHESYIDAVTTENTRRNSIAERRLCNTSIDSNVFDIPVRRTWPQPVFILKGKTPPTVPGRQSPVFVLRDRSNSKANIDASGKRATPTSTPKQPKRRYQPPSAVDDDVDVAA